MNWFLLSLNIIGSLFSQRLKEASAECIKHTETFTEFQDSFPVGIAEEVREMIAKWNMDPDKNENPYTEPTEGLVLRFFVQ